ncbi:MAG: chemoreceptor glutamine deamidase CheD [Thiotrichaceae bacterium]|nr:chemoreceptor glutamine deamidase CheD [Thiotrichaceae bacterium]PCI15018.1 MAG: chemotaxis protein CheD [Thiotrichales bacterium]
MSALPQALPNFEHIKRYWDFSRKNFIAKILPGEVYVSRNHELISTLLGSCIAVCMRDKINHIGGMNHFKLPTASGDRQSANNANYGLYAMELLINEIMKNGGNRTSLECHVFGGGRVVTSIKSDIGDKNIAFINRFLKEERIRVIQQKTGGTCALQVYYHPITGHAFSVTLDESRSKKIKEEEQRYVAKINQEIENNGITYF